LIKNTKSWPTIDTQFYIFWLGSIVPSQSLFLIKKIVHSPLSSLLHAWITSPLGVLVLLVAAVDNGVAGVHVGGEGGDGLINGWADIDQDDDGSGTKKLIANSLMSPILVPPSPFSKSASLCLQVLSSTFCYCLYTLHCLCLFLFLWYKSFVGILWLSLFGPSLSLFAKDLCLFSRCPRNKHASQFL
jgi:hypothetical protein